MTHAPLRLPEFDPCPTDPVLGCLMSLARRHHRLVDEDILAAGLDVDANGHLLFSEIPRAASRAGFTATRVERPFGAIDKSVLPALLLLADGDACILTALCGNGTCELLLPDAAAPTVVPASTLAARYSGSAMSLQPRERPTDDECQPTARPARKPALWWRYVPLALAATPGDVLALTLAALLPGFTHHWGNAPRTVAAVCAVAVLTDGVVRVTRHYLLDRVGRRADSDLAARLFHRLLALARPGSAGAYAAALEAFETERAELFRATIAAIAELPLAIAAMAALAWLGGPLFVIPLAMLPVFVGLGLALQPFVGQAVQNHARDAAKRHGYLVELLANIDMVRALGLEKDLEGSWIERSIVARRSGGTVRLLHGLACRLPDALQAMALVGTAAWGARLVGFHEMRASALAVCLLLTGRVVACLGEATLLLARRPEAMAAVRGLRAALPAASEERAEPHLGRPTLRDSIAFSRVSFRYANRPAPAIDQASLTIRAGERIALCGGPGSGKTTLARLMMGLYRPTSGDVTVDGQAAAANAEAIRPLFGYVPQEPLLFAGSLRDNLTLGLPAPDDETIRRFAAVAGIEGLVDSVGFDGMVGERGYLLSAGQRQGVALARVLMADPSVLLLDDPCAAWDDDALAALAERLAADMRGRTLILISQRRPLLALAQRQYQLSAGRVLAG